MRFTTRVAVTADKYGYGVIGPLEPGCIVDSVLVAGRPDDLTGIGGFSYGMGSSENAVASTAGAGQHGQAAADYDNLDRLTRSELMPLSFGVNVPSELPVHHVVKENRRFFFIWFDHIGSTKTGDYGVWLRVSYPPGVAQSPIGEGG